MKDPKRAKNPVYDDHSIKEWLSHHKEMAEFEILRAEQKRAFFHKVLDSCSYVPIMDALLAARRSLAGEPFGPTHTKEVQKEIDILISYAEKERDEET